MTSSKPTGRGGKPVDLRARATRCYIEGNDSLAKVAANFGTNAATLSRWFTADLGCRPGEARRRHRAEAAKIVPPRAAANKQRPAPVRATRRTRAMRRFITGDETLAEAAATVGVNRTTLWQWFVADLGCRPGEARTRHRAAVRDKAVQHYLESDATLAEAGALAGVSSKTLRKWIVVATGRNPTEARDGPRRQELFAELVRLAEERGGVMLTPKYARRLQLRCASGHEFQLDVPQLRAGRWCAACAGRRITIEAVSVIAAGHVGHVVSTSYLAEDEPLEFECREGHRFKLRWRRLKAGSWCPTCRSPAVATALALAHARGGELLSERPARYNRRIHFRCSRGHEFMLNGVAVRAGEWCARCESHRITREHVAQTVAVWGGRVLDEHIDTAVPLELECKKGHRFRRPWAKLQRGAQCPTCRNPGLLHLAEIAEGHGGELLSETFVLRGLHRFRCARGHEFEERPYNLQYGTWCPACTGPLSQMGDLARSRGGECLSASYEASREPLSWRCSEGHVFDLTPARAKKGRWCPRCEVPVAEMQRLAARRAGRCLSTRHLLSPGLLRWCCAMGHEFELGYEEAVAGQWCPRCTRIAQCS